MKRQAKVHECVCACACACVRLTHLLEVVLGKLVSDTQQFAAGVRVCEGADAEAVGGVQLPLQELAAGFLDLRELQQTRGRQKGLHVALLHRHLTAHITNTSHQLLLLPRLHR